MAFPVVSSSALSSRGSADLADVITMPSGIVAGDLILVFHSTDVGGGTRTWSNGFTELKDEDPTSNVGIGYKIAAGGDTLTITKTVSERFSAIALRITSWHGTTPPEVAAAVTGTSVNPNSGSLSPSWGAADTMWITMHGHDTTTSDSSITAWPTNYTQNQIQGTYFSSSGEPNLATRELNAATEDPGAFTQSLSRPWRAYTVAVRPSAGAPPTTTAKMEPMSMSSIMRQW